MNKFTTNLKKIRAHSPCPEGWTKLLRHLGKTEADDEPLHLWVILESNGLDDALWALRACKGAEKDARLFAIWCARQVQHLMTDERSIKALDVAEKHALWKATDDELGAARSAASAASWSAVRRAVSWAARSAVMAAALDASWSARSAVMAAAKAADWDAARAAQEKRFRQMLEDDGFMEVSNAK